MKFIERWKVNKKSNQLVRDIADAYRKNNDFLILLDAGASKIIQNISQYDHLRDVNDNVINRVFSVLINSRFNKASVIMLAHCLQKGMPINNAIELFDKKNFNFSFVMATKDPSQVDNIVEMLDLLTSFGADWNKPSVANLECPTLMHYLHNMFSESSPQLKNYFSNQVNHSQDTLILSSKDILRHRMETIFSQSDDIRIETGDRVVISDGNTQTQAKNKGVS